MAIRLFDAQIRRIPGDGWYVQITRGEEKILNPVLYFEHRGMMFYNTETEVYTYEETDKVFTAARRQGTRGEPIANVKLVKPTYDQPRITLTEFSKIMMPYGRHDDRDVKGWVGNAIKQELLKIVAATEINKMLDGEEE